MFYNIYCIRNILSGSSDGLFLFLTDGQASVELVSRVKNMEVLKENELFRVGKFNCITRELIPESESLIPWDCRRLEAKMEEKKVE